MTVRRPVLATLLMALSWLMLAGCGPDRPAETRTLPGADEDLARRLSSVDADDLGTLLAGVSTDHLLQVRPPLLAAVHAPSDSSADRARWRRVLAAVDRELEASRGLSSYREESAFLASLPDSVARAVIGLRRAAAALASGGDEPGDRVASIVALRDSLRSLGDEWGALPLWYDQGVLEQRRNDRAAMRAAQMRGAHHARRLSRLPSECRSWGQVLMEGIEGGWHPAMRDTLDDLIARARSARLAWHTAYLLTLRGYDAYYRGRYFSARTSFEDGIEACREYGDAPAGLTAMTALLQMFAELSCWDYVGELLTRADGLLDEAIGDGEPTPRQRLTRIRLRILSARRTAALDRPDETAAIFADVYESAQTLPFREHHHVGEQWVAAMIDMERPALAATAVEATAAGLADGGPLVQRRRIPYWRAWLAWQRGDRPAARAALDRFGAILAGDAPVPAELELPYHALDARVRAIDDRAAARRSLEHGWRGLQERLANHEPGAEAYLDLGRNPHLLWAAIDLLGQDPAVGYGLETLWRRAMLHRDPSLADVENLESSARLLARRAGRELAALEAVHCVYRVRRRAVHRWVASGAGVEFARLTVPADSLRIRVQALNRSMSSDPGDPDAPVPAELQRAAARLARAVLPRRCLDDSATPRTVYVTADGFLAQLPFGALNVGDDGGYEPLVANADVVWLREGSSRPESRRDGRLTALGDADLPDATRRRFGLSSGLPGAAAELDRLASRIRGIAVFRGADLTADRFRTVWDSGRVLYYVGHAVTDPRDPFTAWLPVAEGTGLERYPGIGVADILSHGFERCSVVVLSGCATGLPHVDGPGVSPSLGDAFVDAGVEAAIQTHWLVRDRQDLFQPDRVIARWRNGEDRLVTEFCREQRRSARGARGPRHTFAWAAWSIVVRSF